MTSEIRKTEPDREPEKNESGELRQLRGRIGQLFTELTAQTETLIRYTTLDAGEIAAALEPSMTKLREVMIQARQRHLDEWEQRQARSRLINVAKAGETPIFVQAHVHALDQPDICYKPVRHNEREEPDEADRHGD